MKRNRKTPKRATPRPKRKGPKRAIHANLTAARLAKGWTKTQFATELGIDKTVVWHWENGDTAPNGRILPRVAELLEVSIDELYRSAA